MSLWPWCVTGILAAIMFNLQESPLVCFVTHAKTVFHTEGGGGGGGGGRGKGGPPPPEHPPN